MRHTLIQNLADQLLVFVLRCKLANTEGDPICSAAIPDAELALRAFDTPDAVSEAILAEADQRGMLTPLFETVGALCDHLDRIGALSSRDTAYLACRVRLEALKVSRAPDAEATTETWERKLRECLPTQA